MELLLTVAIVHLIACLSPGPDIFLVVRTALRYGRKAAIKTTFGVLAGVSVHISLGIAGISYLLAQSPVFKTVLALAGGTYLMYLSRHALLPARKKTALEAERAAPEAPFREGLLVNLLNVKAFLFFLSLFSVLLGPEIGPGLKLAAGGTMLGLQLLAFSTVAVAADRPSFRTAWPKLQHWLDFGISYLLLFLGVWIWISTLASLAA